MRARLTAVLFALSLCLPVALCAQTTETDLKVRLIGKPLYLRSSWREDALHFDSYGQLIGKSGLLSFTLSGVEVDKVHLESNALVLEGKRMGVKFNDKIPRRVVLQVGDRRPFSEETMQITIDTPTDGNFSRALDAIFADGLPDLAPALPQYWQRFAHESLLPANSSNSPSSAATSPPSPATTSSPVKRIGGAIKPPTLAKAKEPQFSQAARALLYSGKVLINLWVGENGIPYHLAIVRPAGLGLDEQALYAVQQYVFKPAMENGKPVLVELNIEVKFDIY